MWRRILPHVWLAVATLEGDFGICCGGAGVKMGHCHISSSFCDFVRLADVVDISKIISNEDRRHRDGGTGKFLDELARAHLSAG
jgi:hypothetical protein